MKEFKKISKSGSLSIPIKLRREYGINSGDAVYIEPFEGGGFKVRPYVDKCCLCSSTENVKYVLGKGICLDCAEKAVKLFKEAELDE